MLMMFKFTHMYIVSDSEPDDTRVLKLYNYFQLAETEAFEAMAGNEKCVKLQAELMFSELSVFQLENSAAHPAYRENIHSVL